MRNSICLKTLGVVVLITVFMSQMIMAQDKDPSNFSAPPNVKINGIPDEWNEMPMNTDKASGVSYLFANDNRNLYVVIKISDPQTQMQIINEGITLSVNNTGKKKEIYAMTFPVIDQSTIYDQMIKGAQSGERPDAKTIWQKIQAQMQLPRIGIKGFPKVESESVSVSNTLGFKAAINFDDKDDLCYEEAIPLNLLSLNPAQRDEVAYNIRINELKKPEMPAAGSGGGAGRSQGGGMGGGGGRGGRGGRSGGMGSSGRSGSTGDTSEHIKSTDFWVKQSLAH